MNNEPAFPVTTEEVTHYSGISSISSRVNTGITKREWFAGMAITAAMRVLNGEEKELAQLAFRIADAMLNESNKPQ